MKTYIKTTITEAPILEIRYDEDTESPRQWDNLGYFITKDRNYNSPDRNEQIEHIVNETGDIAESQEEHVKLITKFIKESMGEKVIAIYPVVKYEHSAVYYNLGTIKGFDYSNNGFYIVTDKTAKKVGIVKKDFGKVVRNEIDTYNKWINGKVYSFVLYDKEGDVLDSCSGFYDIEDIRSNLPEEWAKVDLNEYIIND